MGQTLDICASERSDASHTLDADSTSAVGNNNNNNNNRRTSAHHRQRSTSPNRHRDWHSREQQMKALADALGSSNNRKIDAMLSRAQGSEGYSSTEQHASLDHPHSNVSESKTEARVKYHKQLVLQQSLCNPNVSGVDILRKFEFLSVEQRHILHELYVTRKSTAISHPPTTTKLSNREKTFVNNQISSISLFSSFTKAELVDLSSKFVKQQITCGTRIIVEKGKKKRNQKQRIQQGQKDSHLFDIFL